MRLHEIVRDYLKWAAWNFPMPDPSKALQKLSEEVGEANGAAYRQDRIALEDAFGDIFLALIGACRAFGIDPKVAFEKTWAVVSQRDYVTYPRNGRNS